MIQNNWQELIKPTKLDIVPGHDSNRHVRIVAEPLERGFGLTLGNPSIWRGKRSIRSGLPAGI